MSTQEETDAAEVAAIINRLKDEQEALLKRQSPSESIYSGEHTGLRNLWSGLVRKGLAWNKKKSATYGYNGSKASNNYALTELGKEVRAALLAPERAALGVMQDSYGTVSVPVWMLVHASGGRYIEVLYSDHIDSLKDAAAIAGVFLNGKAEIKRILAKAMAELEHAEQAAGGEG